MKYQLLLLLLIVGFVPVFNAQTNVSGGIFQNTTWTLAGSPYLVNGSVVVFPGNTLTVEPGVTILINNSTSSNLYIEARGTLNMLGTDQLPITVKCLYDTLSVGWTGFKCTSSQGGVLNADRFRISNALIPFDYESPLPLYAYTNCWFSYCGQGVTVGNEVILNDCKFTANQTAIYGWSYFTINGCSFQNNVTAINAYSTIFTLTNSTFTENTNGIIFSSGVFESMLVQNCIFQNNGIAVSGPNNGLIELCSFLDNTVGIQGSYVCEIKNNSFSYNELALNVSVSTAVENNQINENFGGIRISDISSALNSPVILNNAICGNINFNVDNNINVNYSLLTNCFCGLDSSEIEVYLLDGYDDITKGLINYQVYDSSCSTVLSTVAKFAEISALDEFNLNITFSNPVVSAIQFFSTVDIERVELLDVYGKVCVLKRTGYNLFDVSELPSGIYFLNKVNSSSLNKKIIKI